jgi:hypothetical protein
VARCPNCGEEFQDTAEQVAAKAGAAFTMILVALILMLLVLRYIVVPLVRGMVS